MTQAGIDTVDVEAALQSYVQSAAMPCPYARLPTRYIYLLPGLDERREQTLLEGALDEFWSDAGYKILAVVPCEQPSDHFTARRQAYTVRLHWHRSHLQRCGGLDHAAAEVRSQLEELYSGWISDTLSFVGPRMVVGDADVMMTAFNPLYDPAHPRFAPYAVLVVIRSRDLRAVHEKSPSIALDIAAHSKCKMILSMLRDRSDIALADMRAEYEAWVEALSYYRDFIATAYTAAFRVDPTTVSTMARTRKMVVESMASERFRASLVAFRAMVNTNSDVPCLQRILAQNPDVSVFDIARVVYGDVAGMYVMP